MKTEFERFDPAPAGKGDKFNMLKTDNGRFIAFNDVPKLVEELEELRMNTVNLVTRNAIAEQALHKMREKMVSGDTKAAAQVLYDALSRLHEQTRKELAQ